MGDGDGVLSGGVLAWYAYVPQRHIKERKRGFLFDGEALSSDISNLAQNTEKMSRARV